MRAAANDEHRHRGEPQGRLPWQQGSGHDRPEGCGDAGVEPVRGGRAGTGRPADADAVVHGGVDDEHGDRPHGDGHTQPREDPGDERVRHAPEPTSEIDTCQY